jgi:hypothetical protein
MLAAMPAAEAIPASSCPCSIATATGGADRAADGRRVQTTLEEHRVAQLLVVAGRSIQERQAHRTTRRIRGVVISKSRDTPIHRS